MQGMQWSSSQAVTTAARFIGVPSGLTFHKFALNNMFSVVQPPQDQQSYARLGVFYFAMSDDDVKLAPLSRSPILQRVGIKHRFEGENPPTMEQWRKSRTSAYGQSELTKKGEVEEEIINGVVVKHYN